MDGGVAGIYGTKSAKRFSSLRSVISTVQFYSLASSQKGYGRKIVEAVVRATPDDWNLVVAMDWSGGFWDRMLDEYQKIVIL